MNCNRRAARNHATRAPAWVPDHAARVQPSESEAVKVSVCYGKIPSSV
jgi:hypothetical protein